jgi:hypothetical protein
LHLHVHLRLHQHVLALVTLQMHVQMQSDWSGREVELVAGETWNGRSLLSGATWRKSSHSGAVGNCVELATAAGGLVAIRNSRNARGPVLIHNRTELAALLADIKDGKFDDVAH